MAKSRNSVHLIVDRNYFDKCFEPERRRLSNKIGKDLSQSKFTAYLHASGARIRYPKKSNKYAPKRRFIFR